MASPSYHLSFNQYWLTSNLAVTVPLGASMIARWLSSVRSWGNGPSAISSVLTSSLSVILTKTQQMQTVRITRDSITTAQVIFPTISCVREVIAAESTLGRSMFLDIKLFTYWAKDQCQYQKTILARHWYLPNTYRKGIPLWVYYSSCICPLKIELWCHNSTGY